MRQLTQSMIDNEEINQCDYVWYKTLMDGVEKCFLVRIVVIDYHDRDLPLFIERIPCLKYSEHIPPRWVRKERVYLVDGSSKKRF